MASHVDQELPSLHRRAITPNLDALAPDSPRRKPKKYDVAQWANALLADALAAGTSDIHMIPHSNLMRVSLRIDGVLFDVLESSPAWGLRLLRYLKTLADLDPVKTFVAHDARCTHDIGGVEVDLRLATVPTACGEQLTIRVFDPKRLDQRITQLGFSDEDLKQVITWLGSVTGMFLVTGPTGSGKTTTLYALLNELRGSDRKVVTIENPVEYQVDGVAQIAVDERHGLTYAEGVKAILRQDPDYVLIGEVRSPMSADAAIGASSTGRAVLSTLHARDAVGTVTSLRNWQVEDHEIATSLEMVVAQRLIRTLCPHCRRTDAPTETESMWLASLGLPTPEKTWHAVGCDQCHDVGFHGRSGVFEVWRLDQQDHDLILTHADERSIREALSQRGHRPLIDDGLTMVANGQTTLDELRILGSYFVPPRESASARHLTELVERIGK